MAAERSDSALDTIRTKEREFSLRLEAARKEADAELKHARREAEERLEMAKQNAAAETRALLEKAIASAEREAAAIRKDAEETAARTWEQKQDLIAVIAERVVAWVLPEVRPAELDELEERAHATPHGQGPGYQHTPPS